MSLISISSTYVFIFLSNEKYCASHFSNNFAFFLNMSLNIVGHTNNIFQENFHPWVKNVHFRITSFTLNKKQLNFMMKLIKCAQNFSFAQPLDLSLIHNNSVAVLYETSQRSDDWTSYFEDRWKIALPFVTYWWWLTTKDCLHTQEKLYEDKCRKAGRIVMPWSLRERKLNIRWYNCSTHFFEGGSVLWLFVCKVCLRHEDVMQS